MWLDRRITDLFGIEHPILVSPMGGAMDWEMTVAVAEGGGLGSLPCIMFGPDRIREEVGKIRARTDKPFNLGFFAYKPAPPDNAREASWRDRLKPYYDEFGLDPNSFAPPPARAPFNDEYCALIEELKLTAGPVSKYRFGMMALGHAPAIERGRAPKSDPHA